jgi:hypothetical protein
VSGQLHAPVALPQEKDPPPPRYSLDRRLGGPQSRSGRRGEEKILEPTGTRNSDPSVVQPVVSHYTDYVSWRHKKSPRPQEMLETVPAIWNAFLAPPWNVHIHVLKFLLGNRAKLKLGTWSPDVLCWAFWRKMFKRSIDLMQFFFSEHLAFWFGS